MALRVFPKELSLIGPDIDFLKSNKVLEKNNWMHCTLQERIVCQWTQKDFISLKRARKIGSW